MFEDEVGYKAQHKTLKLVYIIRCFPKSNLSRIQLI